MREIKVGDRFGRLVVIKKISKGRSLLRCDCGNTLELVDSQLRPGTIGHAVASSTIRTCGRT